MLQLSLQISSVIIIKKLRGGPKGPSLFFNLCKNIDILIIANKDLNLEKAPVTYIASLNNLHVTKG